MLLQLFLGLYGVETVMSKQFFQFLKVARTRMSRSGLKGDIILKIT